MSVLIRLRDGLQRHLLLYRLVYTARFALTVGPWRPLVIRYLQHRQKNPPLPEVHEPTMFPSLNIEDAVASLHRLGWAPGLNVPAEYIDDALKHAAGPPDTMLFDPHLQSASIRRIAFDPGLLAVARRYIGAEPLFAGTIAWRSKVVLEPIATTRGYGQKFHFDVPDFRSLTVFIYLTDVDDAESGAHMLIEGTHKTKTLGDVLNNSMTDAVAQAKYGDRIKTITGPRGTGFFEELTTVHKGAIPRKPRVILQISYTLRRRPIPKLKSSHESEQQPSQYVTQPAVAVAKKI